MIVTLDYDVKFEDFPKTFLFALVSRYCEGKECYVRRSANGRTHVKIMEDVEDFYKRITIRSLLFDDPARISNDIRRHAMGKPTDRLFDIKGYDGVVKHAGEWIPLSFLASPPTVNICQSKKTSRKRR
ncbi:MAG: hypothetical protein QW745_08050 [Thermoplasmata archaeon]|uniref:hypothetical protein n=1 Tax=Metallosphaera sp. TaxID=2020860 RepID=UPI0027A9FDD5|nr:hypothetical protein SPV3_ORF13 [Sulfolobus polyhedral virus 3]